MTRIRLNVASTRDRLEDDGEVSPSKLCVAEIKTYA